MTIIEKSSHLYTTHMLFNMVDNIYILVNKHFSGETGNKIVMVNLDVSP